MTSSPFFGEDLPDINCIEADPIALMLRWLPPNSNELRQLMTLSSIDADGFPDARSVLLSSADRTGLHFHTDRGSRKAAQLAANPKAAGVLVWPDVGRQLVVTGRVEREPQGAAEISYAQRSRYLQLLAWANTADIAQLPQPARRERWAAFARQHPAGTLHAPGNWVGFLLRPLRLTFWRGDADGPSNRVEYRRAGDGWAPRRLPG